MNPLYEALAALEHEQWGGWMSYLFEHSHLNEDGSFTIPVDLCLRWSRQLSTPYDDLPESEKESDRKEADRVMEIVRAAVLV